MIRSRPSRAYQSAAKLQGFGPAWHTANQDLADYTYAFFSFSRALYRESAPKKRRNEVGQDFAYEFRYLSAASLPNAYAFSDSSGNLFAGITASLYGLVNRVCDRMFADGMIDELLNEEIAVTAKRERRLTVDYLDLPSKESIIFSNFLVEDEDISAPPPADWRDHYEAAGDFLLATSLKYRVRDAILSFIFHHEMGHLIEGHIGLMSGVNGAAAVRESDCSTDQTTQRLSMEFQADTSASKALVLLTSGRHAVGRHFGIENDWNRSVTINLLSIYIAHTILTMSAMASEQIINGQELSGLEVKNIFHRSTSYPSAGVRTVTSLNTFINAVEAMHSVVAEVADPEDARLLRCVHMMKALGDVYGEFALMMTIANLHEDDFHEQRQGIAKSAWMNELGRRCAPYSFGGFG